jgi:hypothetical protein
VWPRYPVIGATVSFSAAGAACLAPMRPAWWRRYPYKWQALALLGALIMLDDAVSHALGLWTPLDHYWNHVVQPRFGIE